MNNRIIEAIRNSKYIARTNTGLAKELNLPTPSVRRATRKLVASGELVITQTVNDQNFYAVA